MSVILSIIAGLFFLKLAWNVLIPIDLARRARASQSDKPAGTSLMPYLEIALWLLWLLLAFFSSGPGWLHSPKMVAIWGGCAILTSYQGFAIVGLALGLASKRGTAAPRNLDD